MFTKFHCHIPGQNAECPWQPQRSSDPICLHLHGSGQYEYLFTAAADITKRDGAFSDRLRDGSQNPGVHIYLGCSSDDDKYPSSTVRGDILRVLLVNDAGGRSTFDVSLNLRQGSEGVIADSWVHIALSVASSGIRIFVNGDQVEPFRVGWALGPMQWATTSRNLALGDITAMSTSPGTFTMSGCAFLGGAPSGWAENNGYAGSFAGVQILNDVLDSANAQCLYGLSSQHAGICP
eukprot:SAG31_NODE_14618_length_796_cov_1.110473_1_plen_234_part_01